VDEVGLVQLDELPVAGFGGAITIVPTFAAEIGIRNLRRLLVEILAHPDEPYVLLGRDVLNQYRCLLDGPALGLEID
jgi:hypothetical protein